MKIAFSTLGCPGWTFHEIFATAKDLSMQGIEIRGIEKEIYAPHTRPFLAAHIDETMREMKEAGMVFPILSSGAAFVQGAEGVKEAKDYIDLAKRVQAPYIRVLCEPLARPTENIDMNEMVDWYREVLDYAKGTGVDPLIETSGALADSKVMAEFLGKVDRDNALVLWDVHHPFRYFGERPEETMKNLSGKVRHVHVKDSVTEDGKTVYRMMGYGDVPILDCMRALKKDGYDGFVSLEWLKRWAPGLEEPGIVFSHFANYMQYLFTQL